MNPDLQATRYIDTDLNLYSRADLSHLAARLEDLGVASFGQQPEGRWYFQASRKYKSPAKSIERIFQAFDSLEPSLAALLKKCRRRTLDIGFEANEGSVDCSLPPTLLARLAEHGFELVVTVYGPEKTHTPIKRV